MSYVPVPKALLTEQSVNAYSDSGEALKKSFHTQGKKFLKQLAASLGDVIGEFGISSNMGGIAVSGEVTLHSDHLYIQLSEHCGGERGIHMLYRTCKGRKDYCGGQNNSVAMRKFAEEDAQYNFQKTMQRLAASMRATAVSA